MKLHVGIVSVLLMLSFMMGSCKKENKLTENDLKFAEFKLDTVCHLFNDTAKPGCKFQLSMQYPSASEDKNLLKDIQRIFIESYFGAQYKTEQPEVAARSYMKAYIADYQQLEKDSAMFNQAIEEGWGLASFNYEEISSCEFTFNKNGFVSYAINMYSYTGGAHGMNGTSNHVIDLSTKSLLTLTDLFPENVYQEVGSLIIKQIARDRNFTDPAQLNEDGFFSIEDVVPTDNFRIDEKGITWIYNPYEIAVYATGQISVTLDWALIKPYLLENSVVMNLVELAEK